MSYSGSMATDEGPFHQGLSTTTEQDTWAWSGISYTTTDTVATIVDGLLGVWRLQPHVQSDSSKGFIGSYRPSATETDFSKFGALVNWDGGGYKGDEGVLEFDSSCGYYEYDKTGSGTFLFVAAYWSTTVEIATGAPS
jgi:hypothetical protein